MLEIAMFPICSNCQQASSVDEWDDLRNDDPFPIYLCPKCHTMYARYEYTALAGPPGSEETKNESGPEQIFVRDQSEKLPQEHGGSGGGDLPAPELRASELHEGPDCLGDV